MKIHIYFIYFWDSKLLFPSSVFNVAVCPFWTSLFWVSYNTRERPESADRDLNGQVWRHIKNSHFPALVIWAESWCLCMFVWHIKNIQCIKYKNSYQPLCVLSHWGNQARLQVQSCIKFTDLKAILNICFLREIKKQLKHSNKTGFHWKKINLI